jgi:hypothetical protein
MLLLKRYEQLKRPKAGSRHILLYYRRSMDRVCKATFLLGIVAAMAGGLALLKKSHFWGIGSDVWLLALAVIAFLLSAITFLTRYMAFVQTQSSYMNIVTPFFRFRISYRRIRSAYPALMQQLFPGETSSWSQHNFLKPFYGKTVLVVELFGYPINLRLLRLFLPGQMFSPRSTGFIFMVSDWMKLSTELDTFRGAWIQGQSNRNRMGK